MVNPSEHIRKHHRFVRRLKMTLTVSAGMLLGLLLVWPQLTRQQEFIKGLLKNTVASVSPTASIDMTQVRFVSEDSKGQPFTVTSDKVLETNQTQKLVKLDKPKAHMTMSSGVQVFSDSPFGLFYQNEEILVLPEKVHIRTDNGYTGDLSEVHFDHKNETAHSPNFVKVRGIKGALDAQKGFLLTHNGDKIDFLGQCKLVLKDKGKTYVITSEDGIDVRQTEQTVTAKKNATLTESTNRLFSDTITGVFIKDAKGRYQLTHMKADGNVRILTSTEKVTGKAADYDMATQTATITGDVLVVREEGEMRGQKATINMKTGVSKMSSKSDKERVSGILLPTKTKKDKVK